MKYTNSHHKLPTVGPVYFLGPTAKETLGYFVGGQLFFQALDNSVRGYYSKWWRELSKEELLLIPELPTIPENMVMAENGELKKKRGRKKKLQ